MTDRIEPAHSPVGPSSGERVINCPGSVQASRGTKQGKSSFFAAEGTAAHTLSEWCREEGRKAATYIGQKIQVEDYEFTVDAEMAGFVQQFVDWCEGEPGTPFVEVSVRYEEFMPGGYGTLDDARGQDGIVTITDLKYGKGKPVFVEENIQLRLYALGFYLTYGHLFDIAAFRLRISQPRLDYAGEELITVEQLLDWGDRVIRPAAEKISNGVLEFKAGSWCQWCPVKYNCETRQRYVVVALRPEDEFEDLDAAADAIVNDLPVFSPDMPPERLNRWLEAAKPVIKFFKDCQTHAANLLARGQAVGEWKLVPGRNTRVYTNEEKVIVQELKNEGLTDEEIWQPRELKSPPQIEKRLGKKHVFMTNFVEAKPGKPTLAPGSDKRKPVTAAQLAAFEDLGEAEEVE